MVRARTAPHCTFAAGVVVADSRLRLSRSAGNTRSSAARTSGSAAKERLELPAPSSHSNIAIVDKLVFQKSCRAVTA